MSIQKQNKKIFYFESSFSYMAYCMLREVGEDLVQGS